MLEDVRCGISGVVSAHEGEYVIVARSDVLKVCRVNEGQHYAIQKLKFSLDDIIGQPLGQYYLVQLGGHLSPATRSQNGSNVPDSTSTDVDTAGQSTSAVKLSQEHIEVGRCGIWKGDEAVERLVRNNATFDSRTSMAKEKYVSRKQKKYGDTLLILRPTIRLIWRCYFSKDPERLHNMTLTSLGLILGYADVQAASNICVLDFCLGIVTASVLERLNGTGTCLHIHQHDVAQGIPFFHSLNLTDFQKKPFKPMPGVQFFAEDQVSAYENTFHSVVIAGAQFNLPTVLPQLVRALKLSCPIVIYTEISEYAVACYEAMRLTGCLIDVAIVESNTRQHQMLPERSHPVMKQNVGRGFVVKGVKVE